MHMGQSEYVSSVSTDSEATQLEGWKEIAAYLRRTVRTVQRWEKEEGLPVRRHQHLKAGSVTAYKSELDCWLKSRHGDRGFSSSESLIVSEVLSVSPAVQNDKFVWLQSRRLLATTISLLLLTATLGAFLIVSFSKSQRSRVTSNNGEAKESYSRGRYTWHKGRFEDSARSFERAVQLDPNFVEAWEGLANAHVMMGISGTRPPKDSFPQAEASAQRALSLNQSSAESHATLGLVNFFWHWNKAGAEREFAEAVALNKTSAIVHQSYAYFLSATERHEDAIAHARRAQELEPLSVTLKATAGWFYYMARRYEDALTQWRKANDLEPQIPRVQSGIVAALRAQGNYEEARNEEIRYLKMIGLAARIPEMNTPDAQQALRNFYRLRLEHLKSLEGKSYVPPGYFAQTYANLNDREPVFQWLEKALAERDIVIPLLSVHPLFDQFRSDPRFQQIVLQTNVIVVIAGRCSVNFI